jgi:hypothetical protein
MWNVVATEEFEVWFEALTEGASAEVQAKIALLEQLGPNLGRPHADTLSRRRKHRSKHANMKELRVQHAGDPTRVLFAFDPARTAILLIGGCKAGDDRWYADNIPRADALFDAHLKTLG